MTGYSPESNQDGLPGLIATWAEDGVGCEECHGPGSDHMKKPLKENISVVSSSRAYGKCTNAEALIPNYLFQKDLLSIMSKLTNYCQGLIVN